MPSISSTCLFCTLLFVRDRCFLKAPPLQSWVHLPLFVFPFPQIFIAFFFFFASSIFQAFFPLLFFFLFVVCFFFGALPLARVLLVKKACRGPSIFLHFFVRVVISIPSPLSLISTAGLVLAPLGTQRFCSLCFSPLIFFIGGNGMMVAEILPVFPNFALSICTNFSLDPFFFFLSFKISCCYL